MGAEGGAISVETLLQNVGDLLQEQKPVSYKWLAREYCLPANYAKQLLFRFAKEHAASIQAIYAVGGMLKSPAQDDNGQQLQQRQHVVRLVPASQLEACCEQLLQDTITKHVHR